MKNASAKNTLIISLSIIIISSALNFAENAPADIDKKEKIIINSKIKMTTDYCTKCVKLNGKYLQKCMRGWDKDIIKCIFKNLEPEKAKTYLNEWNEQSVKQFIGLFKDEEWSIYYQTLNPDVQQHLPAKKELFEIQK